MSTWASLELRAVKLPSGAWVRTDHVDAVVERHGDVYVILSCGEHVKATLGSQLETATDIIKMIWSTGND